MFDITGADIARLNDADLRTLVARLAIAELAARKFPISAVTAGGHQDAKDGGIDVRVDLDAPPVTPDFVPRAKTGFQVKKPDMPASSIAAEMRPTGVLRSAIAELADAEGAYIIVSAQGSVTDTALAKRRQAMRDALAGHPKAAALLTDFYDRERLANWANHFPGVGAWVRSKSGGAIAGWRPIGKWVATDTAADGGYLVSDAACFIDARSKDVEPLSIVAGIAQLRTLLAAPRQCIRLIGMSGLGKTRLAQALFEPGVGDTAPLDPALSVYTDYSDNITPPAREMARRLVDSGQRAILVVDNCNPATHGELARVCSSADSNVSLLTIEYDVRDDEPERTDVFRLTSASSSLVKNWLERDFPNVSQVDGGRMAEFSDGNFRIARALAETLQRGETLGQLKNQDLFERIFIQRNSPNNQLLHDGEILALLYSFDGENESADGELARLAEFGQRTVRELYGSITDLRQRGLIQSRGRWRAVLPQAIANQLAAGALERIPPGDFDAFCGALPPRMLRSLSRRIGYLHDSEVVQTAVARWLNPAGALGDLTAMGDDGLTILRNIAPVLPELVLMKILAELHGENGPLILALSNPQRWQWISLLKSLAYEPAMFERAATLLARFAMAERPSHNSSSATSQFGELFHLYLSGTMAPPEQRRVVARKLLESPDEDLLWAGVRALDSILEVGPFTSSSIFEFGARPRTFGWHPKINGDVYSWYEEAINLAVDLAAQCEETKAILARHVPGLWRFAPCHNALDEASQCLASTGWVDGWIGFRAALRFAGKSMPDDIRDRLVAIIERLKPVDLLTRARAFLLSQSPGGYDVAGGEDDDAVTSWQKASQAAVEIGKAIGADRSLTTVFLPEVIAQDPQGHVFEFGKGLAQGTNDPAVSWEDLLAAYRAAPVATRSNATVLGGFIAEVHILDRDFAGPALDAIARDPDLGQLLPYFQARVALDEEGLDRLRRAIPLGLLKASDFACLSNGVIKGAPVEPLIDMLEALTGLNKGIGEALDILRMRFYCSAQEEMVIPAELLLYGRELLKRTDFCDVRLIRLKTVVECCLVGPAAADDARIVCRNLRVALEEHRASAVDADYLLEGLFKTQPEVALDCFLLDGPPAKDRHLFEFGFLRASPVEGLDAATLAAWADKNPADRYPRLGDALSLFVPDNLEEATGLSPLFLDLLTKAPDKARFLGDGGRRLSPSGWSGSLADILEKRKVILAPLANDPDPSVKAWFRTQRAGLDDWIAEARRSESRREESFE